MDRRAFLQFATPSTPKDLFLPALREATPPLFRIPPELANRFPFTLIDKALAQEKEAAKKGTQDLSPLNIEAGLEVYGDELGRIQAAHILRRAGFGGSPAEVQEMVGKAADAVVDDIVDAALAYPLPEPPVWAEEGVPRDEDEQRIYLNELNPMWLTEYYAELMRQIYHGGLRERMMLFWHNHFVTEVEDYFIAPYAYRYVTTLQTHALGNFKDFVHAIGIESAMLLYLNGIQNQAGEPNENYARELCELFTMGQFDGQGHENYTQPDLEEIARALTGWVIDPFELTVQLVFFRHDFGEKTIFGRTGTWGYDEVIDILFEERAPQIAEFIARKLYTEFIYAAPNEDLVAELAQVFLDNDFEIAPVVRALFKSAHFHDEQVVGAQIKSPISMITGTLREAGAIPSEEQYLLFYFGGFILGQRLLNPPNVAGWPGHHDWIDTGTLPTRWLASDFLVFGDNNVYPALDLKLAAETLLTNADGTIDPNNPTSVFTLAVLLAEHLMPVPLDTLDLHAPQDGFIGDLANNPIPDEVLNGPAHEQDLAKIFLLGQFPWYEWSLDHPLAAAVLMFYARNLAQYPEFQLT